MLDKFTLSDKTQKILFAIGIFAIIIITTYYSTKDINAITASKGFSPQQYIAQKLHPENFKRDYPNGISVLDNALPIQALYYVVKITNISTAKAIYPYMFLQAFVFAFAVAYLAQTLFRNRIVSFIVTGLVMISGLAGFNIAHIASFGKLLDLPQHYGFANAFMIFSIALALKNKYILAFLMAILSFYCHEIIGIFTVLFIGSYVIVDLKLLKNKRFWIGIVLFILAALPIFIKIVINNAGASIGEVPIDKWIYLTKTFSFHWYPSIEKMFVSSINIYAAPIILSVIGFFIALRYSPTKSEMTRKILLGTAICGLLTILGVIFAETTQNPFLIRLSIHRASALITFFAVVYFVFYLYQKIITGHFWTIFLSIYSLSILALSSSGIAILPILLLLYTDIRDSIIGPVTLSKRSVVTVRVMYFIVLIAFILQGLLISLLTILDIQWPYTHFLSKYLNPLASTDFLLHGGGITTGINILVIAGFSILLSIVFYKLLNKNIKTNLMLGSIATICILAVICYSGSNKIKKWQDTGAKVAKSYLEVQLWAKKHTPTDALFMPEPSRAHGWRDFSERSSFGNMREWGYTNIAYRSDRQTFDEGIKRMKELGIELSPDIDNNLKLIAETQKRYYSLNPQQIQSLLNKYSIDYFIMRKKYIKKIYRDQFNKQFEAVYKNSFYVLYKNKYSDK